MIFSQNRMCGTILYTRSHARHVLGGVGVAIESCRKIQDLTLGYLQKKIQDLTPDLCSRPDPIG